METEYGSPASTPTSSVIEFQKLPQLTQREVTQEKI